MRFKSILGAFIFIGLASMIGMVVFIQTKSFGRIATKVISDISQKKAQTKVSIKSIGISIFPPGIELNQVRVKKDLGEGKKISTEFGKLGFYIGLIELEEKKFTLGEIRINDSTIDYFSPEKDEEEIKEIDQKMINSLFDISNELPLRIDTILLANARIFINHDLIEAKRVKLFKRGDSFMVRFHLSNLHPVKEKDLSIDEIWGDAEIGRKTINIHRLKVQHDVHTLLIKGKVNNYAKLKNAYGTFTGEASVHISNIKDDIPLPEIIKLDKGYSHLSFKGGFKDKKINGYLDLSLSDLNSNIINAEQIIASLQFDNSILKLNKLTLVNKNEKLKLVKPVEVLNINNLTYLYQPIDVQLENLDLTNALSILPSLSSLKGELTGELRFSYHNRDMDFKPKEGFIINNLGLIVGNNDPFTILMIKSAKLTSASFRVKDLNEFQMDSKIELKNSTLDLHGKVNSKIVDFKASEASIDLEDFGNISNLDIKGRGKLDIVVSGPLEDTNINLKGKTTGFEVLGYKFGQADKDISIALGDSTVIIHRFESLYRSTPISGTGAINYKNMDIAFGINSPKANYHDLKEIMAPIFSKISFLPTDFDLNAKLDANIFGKATLDGLKIKTEVQYTDLLAYGENVGAGDFVIAMENKIISLNNFTGQKGGGQIHGDFSFDLKSDKMKIDYEWDDIALSSFAIVKKIKLNLQGMLSGSLKGEGTTKDYLLRMNGKMDNTKTEDYKFEDSIVDFQISPSFIKGKASILGSVLRSDFDYSFLRSRPSNVSLDVLAPALKPIAIAFLGQHLEPTDFSGSFKFHLDTQFKGNFEEVNLKANLQSLIFKHDNFSVNYKSDNSQFLIEDNNIKKWDLAISEPDLFVKTSGRGRFGHDVDLENEVYFNSKIFEILIAQVLSSEGFIRSNIKINGTKNDYQMSAHSESNDLDLTLNGVPFPLYHLSYVLDYSDRRLVIKELKTSLENGSIAFKGDIYFDGEYPDVNLKYSLDKAEIPILGKSFLNLTGEGIILGNEPPYNFGGDVIINKGQIVNELNDFSSKSSTFSNIRFLPPNQESALGKLINLNLNVKAESPVRITNSLMDVSLKGTVMLLGNPLRPKGEGRLFSPPGSSRIFFKNSEYLILNADFNFSPKKEITNPDFDVQALTYITSYKIYAKSYGDLERFNFDLTSDPALPRNSILSLIAFGYTDEIKNTLEQKDQQSLTQVGVGSFVFDRFKISDILNKQFGLQVNLGTVLEQSQTDSFLSGRTQEGQGSLGRTRSATKIELKKRLDEALSLSVSSTMGGSIGQRQSMNLNYSLNKQVQVEGVYELRTNAEGETDVISNSIGGDLKFRWTFK